MNQLTRTSAPILRAGAFAVLACFGAQAFAEEGPHAAGMHDREQAKFRSPGQMETAGDVGGVLPRPPQAILPPLICRSCCGPSTSGYCLPGFGYQGFLYYGTSPYGDDPFNELRDCPGGNCGNPAAAWTIHRIEVNNAHDPTASGGRRR